MFGQLMKIYTDAYMESGLVSKPCIGSFHSAVIDSGDRRQELPATYQIGIGRIPMVVNFVDEYPDPFIRDPNAEFCVVYDPREKKIVFYVKSSDGLGEISQAALATGKRILLDIIHRFDHSHNDPLRKVKTLSSGEKQEAIEACAKIAQANFGEWGLGKEE